MSALKIKDAQGNWIEVPMIKGDKGDKGEQGDTYELTKQDKQDIADLVEVPEPLKYIKDDPSNNFSVIEGCVSGDDANVATGAYSHAEGLATKALGYASHSEGNGTQAKNSYSHAEGYNNISSADYAHSEGYGNRASGTSSHAEGEDTEAISGANASHVEGKGTLAITSYQHAQGKYNNPSYDYAFMIGNGSSKSNRSNAYTLDWDGNGVYAGKLTVGTAPTNDMDVATKKYVDDVKGASIHICSSEEYDSTTRVPTIQNPDEKTFYLVPSEDGTSPDLFVEWAYVNNAWEMFGSASIDLSNYVTNTDYATGNNGGVVRVNGYGLKINASNGIIQTSGATSGIIKSATGSDAEYRPVTPLRQHESTFYGLAKASGDSTQSASANAVGTYTDEAKASIKNMLGVQDGMVVNATLMSDPWYSVDKTYAEIGLAVADGTNVVILSDGKVFPYAGMMYFQSVPVITFGSFFAYDGKLVSNGFIVTMDDNDATIAQKIQSETTIPTVNVDDVQINGTSIVSDGVANVPIASKNVDGVVKIGGWGLIMRTEAGVTRAALDCATSSAIKNGEYVWNPIPPARQHESVFYGLAKVAGDTTQKASRNAVGTYTEEAKSAISDMLNGSVTVSGTTPTIVAKSGIRYVCGELASLDFTPCATGICDVVFTSGTTPTVLVVPSTVKWANGFDPTSLDADTTYELNIMDGLGVCGTWT